MTESTKIHVDAYTIDGDLLKVLINSEGQYSVWPAKKDAPAGWKETGFTGSKVECSEYVDREWTDMRPISLQVAMQGAKH
ncbi:MAG: MbtH family NRPS accessory protein [Sheuella sp.]|jgi:MbtH protein|nr:MbtH family NRPS accessory protein [Sheuella sp.]